MVSQFSSAKGTVDSAHFFQFKAVHSVHCRCESYALIITTSHHLESVFLKWHKLLHVHVEVEA